MVLRGGGVTCNVSDHETEIRRNFGPFTPTFTRTSTPLYRAIYRVLGY